MDELRHAVGLLALLSVPISLGVWLLIHPFARTWRRIGRLRSYALLALPAAAVGAALWAGRRTLLGPDLGTEPLLVGLGVAACAGAIALARVRGRQLPLRILSGFAELSREPGPLLTEGVFARTRNPRYLEFLLSVLGVAAIANHAGTWLLFAVCFPAVHLVVRLEERELRDRFGAAYDAYCRRVPRYLPKRS